MEKIYNCVKPAPPFHTFCFPFSKIAPKIAPRKMKQKKKNRAENRAGAISKIAPKIAPRSFKKSRQKSRRSEMNEFKIVAKRDKFQTWNGLYHLYRNVLVVLTFNL